MGKTCDTCGRSYKCDIYARYVINSKENRSFLICDRYMASEKGKTKNESN